MKRTILTAALLAGVMSGAAWAQSAADAVAQRQAGFKAIAAATGDVKKVICSSKSGEFVGTRAATSAT